MDMDKDEVIEALKSVVYSNSPRHHEVDLSMFPEAKRLFDDLISLRDFILCMSNGNLQSPLKVNGCIAGALKALQANLKHLIWQTKKIAGGDLSQRVDFMGDFSEAFNYMAERFAEGIDLLQKKSQELKESNDALQQEIVNRKKTEQLLEESRTRYKTLATLDPLTGLFNRRYFIYMAKKEMSRSRRHSLNTSFVMLDIDFFKKVNDTYGHFVGDEVIKHVADILKSGLRGEDLICRYGGEEFIILMPSTDLEGAIVAIEHIRGKVEAIPCLCTLDSQEQGKNRKNIYVTISGGAIEVDIGSLSISTDEHLEKFLSDCINDADRALYQAKENGRNRIYGIKGQQFFDATHRDESDCGVNAL